MVPVSWPPWPGSITILPIFRPSARIRERSPLAVGWASRASNTGALNFLPAREESFCERTEILRALLFVLSGESSFASWVADESSSSSASTTLFTGGIGVFLPDAGGTKSGSWDATATLFGKILVLSFTSMLVTGAFPASARRTFAAVGALSESGSEPALGADSTSAVFASSLASFGDFAWAFLPRMSMMRRYGLGRRKAS